MQPYFESVAAGIEATLKSGKAQTVARKTLALEIARLGSRLFSGRERVAWCGVLAPFDLLNAVGVTSCFVEFVGAMLASMGTVEPLLDEAEGAGYAPDCCGYHRAVMGAMIQGLMPEPDFLIATSAPCSGGLAVIENVARQFKKDLFVINVPHDDNDDAIAFVADQLREMMDFTADHLGTATDPERIRVAIEKTNRARALLAETYDLLETVPSPARPRDLINLGIVLALMLGTDAGIEVARAYRDEYAAKVQQGKSGHRGEQVRLMWLQNRIQFKNPIERFLEDELQAAVVVDELNSMTWEPIDPDDPFTGLAKRMLSIPLVGPVERRVKHLQRLARKYRIHGAINPCHWGCRQGTGARGLVEAGLNEIGIPVINLEVDCIDPRSFAEGQLRTRLEAFVEMLREDAH